MSKKSNFKINRFIMLLSIILINSVIGYAKSNLSDITESTTFKYPSKIDYRLYQADTGLNATNSIKLLEFILRDGGSTLSDTDSYPTILNNLTIECPQYYNLRTVALFDSLGIKIIEAPVIGDSIILSSFKLFAKDNNRHVFSIRATFHKQVWEDLLSFKIIDCSTGIVSSALATSNGGGASNSLAKSPMDKIEIQASQLWFLKKGITSFFAKDTLLDVVNVYGGDNFGNRDTDYIKKNITINVSNLILGTSVIKSAYTSTNNNVDFNYVYFDSSKTKIGVLTASDSTLYGISDTFVLIEKTYNFTNNPSGVYFYKDSNLTCSNVYPVNGPKIATVKQCSGTKISTKPWSTSSTLSFVNTDNALEFSVKANKGYNVNISHMSAQLRSFSGGAYFYRMAYSLDSGATWTNNGYDYSISQTSKCISGVEEHWSFNHVIKSKGDIYFRIFAFGTTKVKNEMSAENIWIGGVVEKETKLDASLTSIDSLNTSICVGANRIVAKYSNIGLDTIKSVSLIYKINGVNQDTIKSKDTLIHNFSSKSIYLGTYNFKTPGTYKLQVCTYQPNGLVDSFKANDTLTRFIIVKSIPTFSIIGPDSFCTKDTARYYLSSSNNSLITWTVPTNLINYGNPTDSFSKLYSDSFGRFIIKVKEDNGICSVFRTDTIKINQSPNLTFNKLDTLCENKTTISGMSTNKLYFKSNIPFKSFSWNVSGANYINSADTVILSNNLKNKSVLVNLKVSTNSGCATSINKQFSFRSINKPKIIGLKVSCPNISDLYSFSTKYPNNKIEYGYLISNKFNKENDSFKNAVFINWNSSKSSKGYLIATNEDSFGCNNADTLKSSIFPSPNADFYINYNAGKSTVISLKAKSNLNKKYIWTVFDSLFTVQSQNSDSFRYSIKSNKNYKIQLAVKDSNGCINSKDSIVNINLTAIHDLRDLNFNSVRIFPNPFVDNLNISAPNFLNLQIVNIYGQEVYRSNNLETIQTNNWTAGLYLVKITTKEQITYTYKIIKSN